MNADQGQGDRPTSEVLRALAASTTPSVSFGTIAAAAGSRIHGFALLLFALPETLPLPLPSASGVLGIPLIVISAHLAVYGEGSGWPHRLDKVQVPRAAIEAVARYGAPVMEKIEHLSRPTWSAITRRERLLGLVCLYLSLLLFAPLPFVNAPPALCIAAISFGLIQRDGRIIAVGLAGTVALTATLIWLGLMLPELIGRLFG